MSERQIWKFTKFDGGINSYLDPKDIKTNEFVELQDFNCSKVGILSTLGHAIKSLDVPTSFVYHDIISGGGFYSYFSDYAFAPTDENHTQVTLFNQVSGESGRNAKFQIAIGEEDSKAMVWLFDGQPTGGTLKVSIRVNNIPIHAELDGSGTASQGLTVLKGSDWPALEDSVTKTNTDPDAGDVNLFNKGYIYARTSGAYINNTSFSDETNPPTLFHNIWSDGYPGGYERCYTAQEVYGEFIDSSDPLLNFNEGVREFSKTCTAGNWWENIGGWQDIFGPTVLNVSYHEHNSPNAINPWVDVSYAPSQDFYWEQGNFWSEAEFPEINADDGYGYFNDARYIFGLHSGSDTQNRPLFAIGTFGVAMEMQHNEGHYGEEVADFNPDAFNIYPGEDLSPQVNFPSWLPVDTHWAGEMQVEHGLEPADVELISSQLVWMSIWSKIIEAINNYSGTNSTDQFEAYFGSHDDEEYNDIENLDTLKHVTYRADDTTTIKSSHQTAALNGYKVTAVLTASSVQNGPELIQNKKNTVFTGTSTHWVAHKEDYDTEDLTTFQLDTTNDRLTLQGTTDTDEQGCMLLFDPEYQNENGGFSEFNNSFWLKLHKNVTYVVEAKVWSASDTAGFYFRLGNAESSTFTCNDNSADAVISKEVTPTGNLDYGLMIYAKNDLTSDWFIDNVSVREKATFVGDDLTFRDTLIDLTTAMTVSSTFFQIAEEHAYKFCIGEKIKIDSEHMLIKKIERIGNDAGNDWKITVLRGENYFGSDGILAAHDIGDDIYKYRINVINEVNHEAFAGDDGMSNSTLLTKLESGINGMKQYGSGFHFQGTPTFYNGITDIRKPETALVFSGADYSNDLIDIGIIGQGGGNVAVTETIWSSEVEATVDSTIEDFRDRVVAKINNLNLNVTASKYGLEMIVNPVNRDFDDFGAIVAWYAYKEDDSVIGEVIQENEDGNGRLRVSRSSGTGDFGAQILYPNSDYVNTDVGIVIPVEVGKVYTISFQLKGPSEGSGALDEFEVTYAGGVSGNFSVTTGWVAYSEDITASDTVSPLVIKAKNSAINNSSSGWWYIDDVSIKEKDTTDTVTIVADSVGVDNDFTVPINITQYGLVGEVEQGVDEELSFLVSKSAVSPGDWWTDPQDGNTYYQAYINLYSKLNGSWIAGLFDKLRWVYTPTQENDPQFWDEGGRARFFDSNLKLDNEGKTFDWFDISNYFVSSDLVSNWTWESQGPVFVNKGYDFHPVIKKWTYSNADNSSALSGVYTDNNNIANWNDPNNLVEQAMRFDMRMDSSGNTGVDWTGTAKFYAAAVYDDGGESLPAHKFDTDISFGEIEDQDVLRIKCAFKPLKDNELLFDDKRIIGVRLYYTHSEEGFETFWNLGIVDFRYGFIKANTVVTIDDTSGNEGAVVWKDHETEPSIIELYDVNASQDYIQYDSMPKLETYDSINGFSPYNNTINVGYKTHCIAGRRSFIGNLAVKELGGTRYYNDRMVVSPVNQLDTFPYPDNRLDLDISDGDAIVALKSVGDRVLQFKNKILYVMNISTAIPAEFFVEARHKFKGISNRNHIVETNEGLFWVNQFGAFMYTGDEVREVTNIEDDERETRKIDETVWSSFVTDDSLVGFNPKSKECFVIKSHTHVRKSDGDCFVYNINSKSWTKGIGKFFVGGTVQSPKNITNIINFGEESTASFIYNQTYGTNPDIDGSPITEL